MNNNWHQRSRKRYFLDYHIDSWNDTFLTQYDPEYFAECCYRSGATAATYMANTHTGLLSWPSKLGGVMHPGHKGRDMLKETIDALHKRGLDAIVYYVFVYAADYWNKHPEARTVLADGTAERERINTEGGPHRFATCCINDPGYHDFSLAELAEICDNYDFEGVWPDMTFWPTVCYCDNCRKRYREETGEEMPTVIDWKDPSFVKLIRTRQRWLREFCQEVTDTIKSRKPGMKLAQQSQTFTWDWMAGASAELSDCWDWMSADLYCDRYGLSYSSKLFYSLSNLKPFERVNCWNVPNIHEHVITKTEDELSQVAYSTIMNDGALTIIDQIDPVGTVHTRNYHTMEKVFGKITPYEPYLGGEFCQDVGIYYSLNSNFDQEWNGRPVKEAGCTFEYQKDNPDYQAANSHMKCSSNAAKTLTWYHVPYGVVTKKNLKDLKKYQVLVLSNVAMLDEEEIKAIREFVADGGSLYASKETATITGSGSYDGKFLLSELFGVQLEGRTKESRTYVSPTEEGKEVFPEVFSADFPVTVYDWQTNVRVISSEAKVLGTITLPYLYPTEDRHGSILTTPPGRFTQAPAIVENTYGKGKVIYSTAALEIGTHISQREVFYQLIKRLSGSYCTELEGFQSVEITRFEKPEENCTMLHILNFQSELPNLPIANLQFKAKLFGKSIAEVILLPNETGLQYSCQGDTVEIQLPDLQDYALVCIKYR